MQAIAKKIVCDTLRQHDIKIPTGNELVQFADGTTKSMADMVAGKLARDDGTIEKAAKKVIADRAKSLAAVKEAAANVTEKTAEALGL